MTAKFCAGCYGCIEPCGREEGHPTKGETVSLYTFQKLPFPKHERWGAERDSEMIKITTEAETLPELLESFRSFLLAAGFAIRPDETLELVSEEDSND